MIDLILFVVVMTGLLCGLLLGYSWFFREIIKKNIFNGIDKDAAKAYIENLPFRQRLFMTYIKKCNLTGKQRLGLAIWLIVCHFIHVIKVITLMAMVWYEFFLEIFSDRSIDASAYIMGLQFTYNDLISLLWSLIIFGIPFISISIGLLIHQFSKNKYDLQTIRVTRVANPSGVKSRAYHVFASTLYSAPCRINENETKEFKVVKARQEFWTSQAWAPQQIKKSNRLDVNVLDSVVELEVGCDEDNNLWIKEKDK